MSTIPTGEFIDRLRQTERERDEARALLTVGLALWASEPRPSLRSNWYGFWWKVRDMCSGENKCE